MPVFLGCQRLSKVELIKLKPRKEFLSKRLLRDFWIIAKFLKYFAKNKKLIGNSLLKLLGSINQ